MPSSTEKFPRDTTGVPTASPTDVVELADGDRVTLRIGPVAKRIGDATVRMLAYNGSIPGPTLRVPEGAEVFVDIENEGDMENTVHWHGLRLENRFDGTHETQDPIPVGGRYTARVTCPDPGVYWYHPHIREDYNQELGLYGNVIVTPSDPSYWAPVNRELAVTLDDVLIEDGQIAPFSPDETTYAAMGRFGNVLLVAGEPELALTAQAGEVVRLYLTNTANTRVFRVALPGARMKLVGGDSGRVEREQFVDDVVLAPSERAVVDVLFETPGELVLEHRTPERTYKLADITVTEDRATPSFADAFADLRSDSELAAERERLAALVDAPPDKTLAFVAEMDMGEPDVAAGEALIYTCPMHPEVASEEPGRCPSCGMKLLPAQLVAQAAGHEHQGNGHEHVEHGREHREHDEMGHEQGEMAHGHHAHDHEAHAHHAHDHAATGGVEWEDDMVDVNRITTPANTRWKLIDRSTDAANHAIQWQFTVGDRVKIRLVNEMDSDHPMHHPFHLHGAGRFLVLARDGVAESNLVWKDTVLVRTGQTVDILFDVTNPGLWMAHCHIAEHMQSGMMFSFNVARGQAVAP